MPATCRCRFCGREFANEQAVRAHLKSCDQYQVQKRERVGSLGSPLGTGTLDEAPSRGPPQAPPFDPVRQLGQRVAAERLKLELRNVEEAHADMDRKARAAQRERKREGKRRVEAAMVAESERRAAEQRAAAEREEREQRQRAREDRETARRDAIQNVKQRVIEWWWSGLQCDHELKGRALRLIERKLAALPVEELPESELIMIATGIRDALFNEAQQREDTARQHTSNRQRLIDHGLEYARSELRAVEGLGFSERWRIERIVNSELETIEGDESLADIEDLVESVLDDEDIGWDDDE